MTPAQIGALTVPSSDTGALAEAATLITATPRSADSLSLAEAQTLTTTGGATPTFLEDFSEYTSTANMRTNPAGKFTALLDGSSDLNETFNAAQISLDQTQGVNINGFSLTQCMLYSFPIANVSDYSIGCNLKLDQDYNEGWFELYAMFSANFTTNGPAAGNADYKFTNARTRVTGRYMTFCGTFGDGWQFGYPGNDQGLNSDVSGVYGNSDYPFTSSVAVWDGNWHRYRYHLKNSASGGAVFYIDNFKMPGFPIGTVNTSSGGAIWSWALGRNNNKGQSVAMTVRQGRFAAYASDPGWGF